MLRAFPQIGVYCRVSARLCWVEWLEIERIDLIDNSVRGADVTASGKPDIAGHKAFDTTGTSAPVGTSKAADTLKINANSRRISKRIASSSTFKPTLPSPTPPTPVSSRDVTSLSDAEVLELMLSRRLGQRLVALSWQRQLDALPAPFQSSLTRGLSRKASARQKKINKIRSYLRSKLSPKGPAPTVNLKDLLPPHPQGRRTSNHSGRGTVSHSAGGDSASPSSLLADVSHAPADSDPMKELLSHGGKIGPDNTASGSPASLNTAPFTEETRKALLLDLFGPDTPPTSPAA